MVNRLYSDLSKKAYIAALKTRFESPFSIFQERVTGIALGLFFSVAHHCEYEWNRRITSECNRAIGFVRTVEGRTQINFVRSKGCFSPFWLVFYALIACILLWFGTGLLISQCIFASAACSLILCGISAFVDSLTEAGQEGAEEITRLLLWPDQYN